MLSIHCRLVSPKWIGPNDDFGDGFGEFDRGTRAQQVLPLDEGIHFAPIGTGRLKVFVALERTQLFEGVYVRGRGRP